MPLHPAEPGPPDLVRRQRRLGRLTVAERIDALVDPGSFSEWEPDALELDGSAAFSVRCGFGTVGGQEVVVYAHDATIRRGAMGYGSATKVARLLRLAGERRATVLALHNCDGVRVEEGIRAVQGWNDLLAAHVDLGGVVPQLAAVLGTGVGASAYAVALCDLVVMVADRSFLFVVGPRGVEQATGQQVAIDDLGGSRVHERSTGIAHAVVEDDAAALSTLRRWTGYLGQSAAASTASPALPGPPPALPADVRRPYDVLPIARWLADGGVVEELRPEWAPNLVTGLLRLGGRAVGLVASQPRKLAGCLDVLASRKGAEFVTFCGARHLPLLTLVDVPGYLPGLAQEEGGILRFGADLLKAYGRADIPKIAVVLRRSYGGASVLSCTADRVLALPGARLSSMGAAAASVALGEAAEDPVDERLQTAVDVGYVDEVVELSDLQVRVRQVLAELGRDRW